MWSRARVVQARQRSCEFTPHGRGRPRPSAEGHHSRSGHFSVHWSQKLILQLQLEQRPGPRGKCARPHGMHAMEACTPRLEQLRARRVSQMRGSAAVQAQLCKST